MDMENNQTIARTLYTEDGMGLARIRLFYRHSSADVLCALDGPGAGVLWTLVPRSPEALRRAVRQMRRAQATRVQWIRRLRLRSRSAGTINAVGVYVLPERVQHLYRLDTGASIVCRLLTDECMDVIMQELSA